MRTKQMNTYRFIDRDFDQEGTKKVKVDGKIPCSGGEIINDCFLIPP